LSRNILKNFYIFNTINTKLY